MGQRAARAHGVGDPAQSIDLLTLTNGATAPLLDEQSVPAGRYEETLNFTGVASATVIANQVATVDFGDALP